jgi:hypothetical protein
MLNKYRQINYEMYFHNKLIWSYKRDLNIIYYKIRSNNKSL